MFDHTDHSGVQSVPAADFKKKRQQAAVISTPFKKSALSV